VTEGQSELDRSLMTGESLPVYAGPGMAVSAGEVNLTGPLTVEVRAAGRDTSLHRIADLVAVAESGRANYNSLADQAAKLYAPGVHILSVLAPIGWWIYTQDLRICAQHRGGGSDHHLPLRLGPRRACRDDGGLGAALPQGLLIKDGTALERLSEADTVVFDKTGTLTTGAPEPVALDDRARRRRCASRWRWPRGPPTRWPRRCVEGAARQGAAPRADRQRTRASAGIRRRGHLARADACGLAAQAWVGAEAPDVTATFLKIGEGDARDAFRFTDTLREGAAKRPSRP
jgi:Cu2+-exporting ATPase